MIPAFALTLVIQFANLANAPEAVVREARSDLVDMLRDISVTVEWADDSPSVPPADAIHLTLLRYEVGSLRQNIRPVLGAATRTALGTGIALVFYQRIVEESDRHQVAPARVLACAMAHELGHLLQEAPSHEPAGLMRGVWRESDFRSASAGRLRFNKDAGANR
jgi:hypothetical protein